MELAKQMMREPHLVGIFEKYWRDIAAIKRQVLIYQETGATHLETKYNGALSVRASVGFNRGCARLCQFP